MCDTIHKNGRFVAHSAYSSTVPFSRFLKMEAVTIRKGPVGKKLSGNLTAPAFQLTTGRDSPRPPIAHSLQQHMSCE